MTSAPAYENVPAEISLSLSIEEAAKRAGMTVPYFRVQMSKLNNTEADLRADRRPGERARKYNLDKLDQWINDGMPVPRDPLRTPKAAPGAREITAHAIHKDAYWIVDLPEIGQGTQSANLRNAQRVAHALAVEKLGLAPKEVTINIFVGLPRTVTQKWEDVKTKEREAAEAAASATALSREVIRDLRDRGMTLEDIATALGLTFSRVQQLAQASR